MLPTATCDGHAARDPARIPAGLARHRRQGVHRPPAEHPLPAAAAGPGPRWAWSPSTRSRHHPGRGRARSRPGHRRSCRCSWCCSRRHPASPASAASASRRSCGWSASSGRCWASPSASTPSAPNASEGTLPRLVSQPIHRDDVINGKFVAGLAVIALILGAVIADPVAASASSAWASCPDGDVAVRLVTWFLAAALYVGFWLALATLCSVVFRRAATAALVVLAVWLVLTFFGDQIVSVAANVAPTRPGQPHRRRSSSATPSWSRSWVACNPITLFTEMTQALLNPLVQSLDPYFQRSDAGVPCPRSCRSRRACCSSGRRWCCSSRARWSASRPPTSRSCARRSVRDGLTAGKALRLRRRLPPKGPEPGAVRSPGTARRPGRRCPGLRISAVSRHVPRQGAAGPPTGQPAAASGSSQRHRVRQARLAARRRPISPPRKAVCASATVAGPVRDADQDLHVAALARAPRTRQADVRTAALADRAGDARHVRPGRRGDVPGTRRAIRRTSGISARRTSPRVSHASVPSAAASSPAVPTSTVASVRPPEPRRDGLRPAVVAPGEHVLGRAAARGARARRPPAPGRARPRLAHGADADVDGVDAGVGRHLRVAAAERFLADERHQHRLADARRAAASRRRGRRRGRAPAAGAAPRPATSAASRAAVRAARR